MEGGGGNWRGGGGGGQRGGDERGDGWRSDGGVRELKTPETCCWERADALFMPGVSAGRARVRRLRAVGAGMLTQASGKRAGQGCESV